MTVTPLLVDGAARKLSLLPPTLNCGSLTDRGLWLLVEWVMLFVRQRRSQSGSDQVRHSWTIRQLPQAMSLLQPLSSSRPAVWEAAGSSLTPPIEVER